MRLDIAEQNVAILDLVRERDQIRGGPGDGEARGIERHSAEWSDSPRSLTFRAVEGSQLLVTQ